jgi:Dolichyl-phosphate-mannose-protein mannosyltransferase
MTLEHSLVPSRQSLFKWFFFILTAKITWLVLFTVLRNPAWNADFLVGTLGLYGGDSLTYYYPVEELIRTGQYHGMCRMPGVLPVYFPLRMILSEAAAQELVVVLQVIFDSISTLLLALLSVRVFKQRRAFMVTILFACITSFVSLRSIYLLSDSFCISALITSFYFLSTYFESQRKRWLIYAGVFLTWAIFLRQITLLSVPIMGIMIALHHRIAFKKIIIAGLLLATPLAISLGIWTMRNRITYGRTVVLVAPLDECMYNLTPELAAIRSLIIALGEDFQPWSKGGGAYWFFNQPVQDTGNSPFNESHYTGAMKQVELDQLRADYRALADTGLSKTAYDSLQHSVIERSSIYVDSYKSEHGWNYHVGNKIQFAFKFLFPARIDDIPFPAVHQMNWLQKGIKAWSLVSLWLVHALAILVALWWLLMRRWDLLLWTLIPFSFIVVLSYLGYIEQRYLATSFPFFLMLIAGGVSLLRIKKKESTLSGADN